MEPISSHVSRDDNQKKFLDEASLNIKTQSFHMNRAIDAQDLVLTLKYASEILRELRTGLLTPKNYYCLYMQVLDELRNVETFFEDFCQSDPVKLQQVYEQVQTCGNILPRLYLLVTMGSTYMKQKHEKRLELLKDLVEMVKGVQRPLRGLFLRNYLTVVTKDKLPDPELGTMEFLLQNFSETNRLWIRMQHQTGARDRKKREQERQELRILISTSLVRMSQLELVTLTYYQETLLPELLKIIVHCRDRIAQQYLMDCLIQIFPDEFHLETLDIFLQACLDLHGQMVKMYPVDVSVIINALLERLSKYTNANQEIFNNMEQTKERTTFESLKHCVEHLLDQSKKSDAISTGHLLAMQLAVVKFCTKSYVEPKEYLKVCFEDCVTFVKQKQGDKVMEDDTCIQSMKEILYLIFQTMKKDCIQLEPQLFSTLIQYLPRPHWKHLSMQLTTLCLDESIYFSHTAELDAFMNIILPLLKDQLPARHSTQVSASEETKEEFEEEQHCIAKLIHLIRNDNADIQFQLYTTLRKYFGQGGIRRILHTLLPLVFCALQLAQRIHQNIIQGNRSKITPRKVLQFVHEIVTALATNFQVLSLRLFLQCACTADVCQFEAIAYEFITQAFILYEDLTDSRQQVECLHVMIGTLIGCRNLSDDNYDTLITKTTQYAAKLLKKSDQCHMVTLCAHLFWIGETDTAGSTSPAYDGKRVLECLQRSLKLADVCVNANINQLDIFVDILNHYLYFYRHHTPQITKQYLDGLIALIREHLTNMEQPSIEAYFEATLQALGEDTA